MDASSPRRNRGETVDVIARGGARGTLAAKTPDERGYRTRNVEGDLAARKEAGLTTAS